MPPPPLTTEPNRQADETAFRPDFSSLLNRPVEQRRKEYQYRFAQAVVFGLPVLALQTWGHQLGGTESPRWVGLLQSLLTGWVLYVGAVGILLEGALTLCLPRRNRRKGGLSGWWAIADFAVACVAAGAYFWSVGWLVFLTVVTRKPAAVPTAFHWVVILVAVWAGFRMGRLTIRSRKELRT